MKLLFKKHKKLVENSTKLNRAMAGMLEYMSMCDTSIWGRPAHNYFLCARSEMFRDISTSSMDILYYLFCQHSNLLFFLFFTSVV